MAKLINGKYLDKEEKEIMESVEKGEWESVKNVKEKINLHQKYAKEHLKKSKSINIRLTEKDLMDLKKLAVYEGLPYQTMISSILHKYVTGRLVDKR